MITHVLASSALYVSVTILAVCTLALTLAMLVTTPSRSGRTVVRHRRAGRATPAEDQPTQEDEQPAQTMYQRVGTPAIGSVVEQFYRLVLADPRCAGYFEHLTEDGVSQLRRHQALLIGQVLGGPVHYDLRVLAVVHRRLGISNGAYAVVVGHLLSVLYGLDVPSDIIKHLQGALEDVRELIVHEPERAMSP